MGKFLKVFDALNDLQEAQKRVPEDAVRRALPSSVEKTIEHLAKLAEKGEKVTSPRDLMRTWYSIADRTLMQKFNTEEFLQVQDKLTDALMKHKKAQRDALEIVYNAMEIPTRSEIDEAYRDIHALKREVRALRKALKEATGKPAQVKHGRKAKEIEATGGRVVLSGRRQIHSSRANSQGENHDELPDPVPAGRTGPRNRRDGEQDLQRSGAAHKHERRRRRYRQHAEGCLLCSRDVSGLPLQADGG